MIFQLGSPLLDACVLAVLSKEDAYGYVLTQNIQSGIDISESTLYPILRRLQKENCLTTYDQPFQGRNRRYYKITEEGGARLNMYKKEWSTYKENIDKFLSNNCDFTPTKEASPIAAATASNPQDTDSSINVEVIDETQITVEN